MGKLRVFSGKQICRLLEQHGFVNIRQRGSHVVMQKKTESSTITVPVPFHPTIRVGALQSISGSQNYLVSYSKYRSKK